jgi:hypothetical protein
MWRAKPIRYHFWFVPFRTLLLRAAMLGAGSGVARASVWFYKSAGMQGRSIGAQP